MQRSWRADGDKLTFIACLPLPPDIVKEGAVGNWEGDAEDRMVGDVNLFLGPAGEDDEQGAEVRERPVVSAEVVLMIASPMHRRRGLGRATLLAFLQYVKVHEREIVGEFAVSEAVKGEVKERLDKGELRLGVKIGKENMRSRKLFESVGFVQVGEVNYFGEVELRLCGGVKEVDGWEELRYGGGDGSEDA